MDLTNKKFVVMGLSPSGLGITIGREVVRMGGEVIYTVQSDKLLARMVRRGFSEDELAHVGGCLVLPCDVENHEELRALPEMICSTGVKYIDGLVHSMAFANRKTMLGSNFFDASQQDVARAFDISAASLIHVMSHLRTIMKNPASVVAMTFESGQVLPGYGWMHLCKAALEAGVRGLAYELGSEGVRVNAISAGPIDTMSAQAIPGFDKILKPWDEYAPLGWDTEIGRKWIARAACNLLGSLEGMTGQIIRIDGGFSVTMLQE